MIVVTGPGRSGTTFLAMLYRELGFDPGGRWNPSLNAGMEARQFSTINNQLAAAFGTVGVPREGPRSLRSLERARLFSEKHLPGPVSDRVGSLVTSVRYHGSPADPMDWSMMEAVLGEHGQSMRTLAARTPVVKDPRFCWTLHAWLASGAAIDSVVLALRTLDSMAASRVRAGMIPERAQMWAKNNFAYGIGLAVAAATEYRIPLQILRFPDFLDQAQDLHERLPLPEPRSLEEFEAALDRVRDASLVHDQS